ncbi:unnamed protein product [Pelagomonas calceolata]|uniref:EF-hand domain-containing protein n=1 Tax=Pelagomonas calceolata TaxID=35677 RepID=A0A8J2SSF8_9STRA|nr:unnamed protein product [Pelagomonas calceolata]|mmetsp:Transcript_18894/g.53872  ORF Transcript_18894/g.53872 Transcript_18894/m.53872 type:complete len:483 (-) Transcript_18894:8-1456(-)
MQDYLAHPSDLSKGHTVIVDGRRLTMANLGKDIVHGEVKLQGPPRPSIKKQFPQEPSPFSPDRSRQREHTGVKRIPPPDGKPVKPLPILRRGVAPAQRESELEQPRRMRKSGEAIAKWQQVDYDTLNPCGIQYENDYKHKPEGENVYEEDMSAKARFREACFGGGHGASMGLIRHIFKRFDTDGDGMLTRDELRLGLQSRNRDITHFDAFWTEIDRDANDKIDMLELARALAEDQEDNLFLNADESMPPAGSPAPVSVNRGKRDGGAIAEWQRAPYDILSPGPRPESPFKEFPNSPVRTSLDRLKRQLSLACHGAGAGASMGLLRSIFKHFDKDGNGRISTDELKRGLRMHGVEVADDDLTAISKEMDLNKDGFVSLSEFAHAICGGFEELTPEEARARRPPMSPQKLRQDFDAIPTSVIRKVFADLVRSGCPKKVPCARLAEALRRHALLDVTENDLKELSSADALTIEELYAAAYREAGA